MYYLDLLVIGLVWGCTYAMMALGLTLVYGLLRILHVAQATVFTLGAYAGLLVANGTGSLALAFAAAIGAACLAGVVIYRWVYEPVLDKPPFVPLVASIGLLIAMEDGFRLVFGPYGLSFTNNPWFATMLGVAGIQINLVQAVLVITAVLSIGVLAWVASSTRLGVGLRATVTDPAMAESFGVNRVQVRTATFLVASALAGVSGLLVGMLNNLVEPGMGGLIAYKGLAIIVLGGLGSVSGTLLASILFGLIESFGTVMLDQVMDRDAVAFLFMLLMLLVRPQGLLGKAR
ncbi:MAG: branched-chain amino acid ABC transporter permease [Limnohabitans sp.]|nr:branched-chain amino acid ABC transporter permease [Limnohabitans sp.]